LENYRDFLSTNEDSKELSLKPAEDLLHELSFLSKKKSLPEVKNKILNRIEYKFCFIFRVIILLI